MIIKHKSNAFNSCLSYFWDLEKVNKSINLHKPLNAGQKVRFKLAWLLGMIVLLLLGLWHHTPKRRKEIPPFTLLFLMSKKSKSYQRVTALFFWHQLLILTWTVNVSHFILKIKLNFDVFLFWRLKMLNTLHWCMYQYFLKKQPTYPCNKPFMTVEQIFFTDVILSIMSIQDRTRLLNISKYSSVRWTKVTKPLMNWLSWH